MCGAESPSTVGTRLGTVERRWRRRIRASKAADKIVPRLGNWRDEAALEVAL